MVHHIGDQHGIVQDVGEAPGLEEHREEGGLPRLLQPAHLLVEFLQLGGLLGLQLGHLPLVFPDLPIYLGQQLPARAHLLFAQEHLGLDQRSLLLRPGHIPADGGQPLLDLRFLAGGIVQPVPDCLDIPLGHRPGGQGQGGGRRQEQQRRRQKTG